MNFNKYLACCCGLCASTIFITYFVNYYGVLESFTENIQRLVIGISSIGAIIFSLILILKHKSLFSKQYIYTTIILSLITLLSMWLNFSLYTRI